MESLFVLWGTLLPLSGSEDSLLSSLPLFFLERESDRIYLATTSSWLFPEEGQLIEEEKLDVLSLQVARKVAYKLRFSKGKNCLLAPGEIVSVMGSKYHKRVKDLRHIISIPPLNSVFDKEGNDDIIWHETRNAGWIAPMTWDRYKCLCADLCACLEGEFCERVRDLSSLPQAGELLELLGNTPSDDHNRLLLLELAFAKQRLLSRSSTRILCGLQSLS